MTSALAQWHRALRAVLADLPATMSSSTSRATRRLPRPVRRGAGRGAAGRSVRMMATPVLRCDAAAVEGFLDDRRPGRVGATTAVFDRRGPALYFSKEVFPYTGRRSLPASRSRSFTIGRLRLPPRRRSRPIRIGRSDRSRPGRASSSCASWRRVTVHCVEVAPRAGHSGSSTTPSDVPRIEAILRQLGMP